MAGAVRHTLRNALRPGYAPVLAAKARRRLTVSKRERAAARDWAASHVSDVAEVACALDPVLWREAEELGDTLRARASALLPPLGVRLGGGGHFELLYFLTRLRRPRVVLETGVAAGYSSAAILAAIDANGTGHLYSSDFPYFRLEEPEQYVGVLVPRELRDRWTLGLAGDEANLPGFLAEIDEVDLLHYDSDKTYAGRRFATEAVGPKLAPDAVCVMDDIQDDRFFRQHVEDGRPYRIFERGGYYLGATGIGE